MTDDAPEWISLAKSKLGQHELAGPSQNNPFIMECFKHTSYSNAPNDETPWCAAFVCWALENCDIESTKSAAAKSYLKWGMELDKPIHGCVVVITRSKDKSLFHVGFYVGEGLATIDILGGNQADSVSIKKFPKSNVVSYRWPIEE